MLASNLNHRDMHPIPAAQGWVAGLRRLAQTPVALEQCDLCSAQIFSPHRHLIEPATRRLVCCCQACAILFSDQQGGKYRRVPEHGQLLDDFQMTEAQWDALQIPISMAFFFHSSAAGRIVAYYPSPAGATESLLNLEAWNCLAADNPALVNLEADVEALLVNRVGEAREYYRAPIDRCYELVGLIRARWRGISGGSQVWSDLGDFFASLRATSTHA